MNKESQVVFLEYFCKGLQKEANLSVSESIGVAIWFADQNYLLTKNAASFPIKTGESHGDLIDSIWNAGRDAAAAGTQFLGQGLAAGVKGYLDNKEEFDSYIDKGKNFISTVAPYAVPGILSYLGLKASGARGGVAMAGALGAGALGGTFWNSQTPEEKQKLLESVGWKSTPKPTGTTQINNNSNKSIAKNDESDGIKETVNTTVRAGIQLNPPPSRYTA